ncbi:MAG: hypothetical protein ACJ75B_08160 [Flavisolibacter sp.]
MSLGEDFIEDFFKSQKITYRREEQIHGLQYDAKSHRIADFYLPDYRVYVEYYGQWNIESQKNRYREKKQVYQNNQLPCIILYPENLGVITYIFPKRMFEVLKRYRMDRELKKYKWKLMLENKGFRLLLLAFALLVIGSTYPWKNDKTWLWVGLAFTLYQSYLFRKEYRTLFYKEQVFTTFFEK